jgi:large subunit ribosomal protein L3
LAQAKQAEVPFSGKSKMPRTHSPRRGTLQFWPRRRSKRDVARIRHWPKIKDSKPLGFLGYKAGMCHLIIIDNKPKSITKGEEISIPATIVECPPIKVAGIQFYKKSTSGLRLTCSIISQNLDKELNRLFTLPKNIKNSPDAVNEFDDIRILIYTQPKNTGIGAKKPKLVEMALGGNKEDKLNYAKEKLGKEILIEEVFTEGSIIDVHSVTKGKGFQGPVKRHGVMLRHHKSEKSRRANIRGPWTGAKMWTVPHSGKMGYNLRTEHNKQILRIGKESKEINPSGGLHKYGVVKNNFILLKGSIPGAKKRAITLTQPSRPTRNIPKEAPSIQVIVQ